MLNSNTTRLSEHHVFVFLNNQNCISVGIFKIKVPTEKYFTKKLNS